MFGDHLSYFIVVHREAVLQFMIDGTVLVGSGTKLKMKHVIQMDALSRLRQNVEAVFEE